MDQSTNFPFHAEPRHEDFCHPHDQQGCIGAHNIRVELNRATSCEKHRPLRYRFETHAAVGEAMAITLFSGLGFVALIATVWLEREQVEAAIQSMEESTKAQRDNLATPQAQSENTLTVAKIRALAVQVSADTAEIRETDKQMEPVIFLDLKKERKRLVENPRRRSAIFDHPKTPNRFAKQAKAEELGWTK